MLHPSMQCYVYNTICELFLCHKETLLWQAFQQNIRWNDRIFHVLFFLLYLCQIASQTPDQTPDARPDARRQTPDAMDLVKKAAAAITRSENRVSDPREMNLYMREVDKNGAVLQDSTASQHAKMAAIKALGFVGYLGKCGQWVYTFSHCHLRPLSRGLLLVIVMILFLQMSRSFTAVRTPRRDRHPGYGLYVIHSMHPLLAR